MLTQIHLINLDRSTDRLAQFNRRNSHLASVVRFSAVDGAQVDRLEMLENGLMLEGCPYASGTLGCALSHIELWKKAQTDKRPITILEDDAIARFKFEEKVRTLANGLPADWDIVLWGYNFRHVSLKLLVDFGFSKASIHCFAPAKFDDWKSCQAVDYNYSLFRLLNAYGTVGYSVSPTGAAALLNGCLPLRKRAIELAEPGVSYWDTGIDGPMNAVYPSIKAFICIPPLVEHDHVSISDRKGTDADSRDSETVRRTSGQSR
jgi:GR25 family glycosyltransferase involved in LPS biosynthesis